MGLRQNYHALDVRERLTVYLSAQERGNREEMAAVIAASERIALSMSDTLPFAMALETLAMLHNFQQTELAFAVMTLKQVWGTEPDAFPLSRYVARRWVVAEAAWREVCAEYGLDYDARAAKLQSASKWSHLMLGEVMPELALTDAECEPWMGLPGPSQRELAAPPTVEEMKREYAEFLAEQAERHSPI